MTLFEFGDAKLRLRDLDPLYWALVKTKLNPSRLKKFTFAEVTFDHAGLAAQITWAKDYWAEFLLAARANLRGAPRRYFRGEVATKAVRAYRDRFGTAENLIDSLKGNFSEVQRFILSELPQYGPCAAFKLADMAERVCKAKIDFSAATVGEICNSKQVLKGLVKAATEEKLTGYQLVAKMRKYKWATLAPPRYDRPLNAQEFETLLCYYSHDADHKGHWPGEDIVGIRKELEGWGPLAARLIKSLPEVK